jgi:hypothetical protein
MAITFSKFCASCVFLCSSQDYFLNLCPGSVINVTMEPFKFEISAFLFSVHSVAYRIEYSYTKNYLSQSHLVYIHKTEIIVVKRQLRACSSSQQTLGLPLFAHPHSEHLGSPYSNILCCNSKQRYIIQDVTQAPLIFISLHEHRVLPMKKFFSFFILKHFPYYTSSNIYATSGIPF